MMRTKETSLYDSKKAPFSTTKHDPETARMINRSRYQRSYLLTQAEVLNKIDMNDQDYDFKEAQRKLDELKSVLVKEKNEKEVNVDAVDKRLKMDANRIIYSPPYRLITSK